MGTQPNRERVMRRGALRSERTARLGPAPLCFSVTLKSTVIPGVGARAQIRAKTCSNSSFGTATSAIWNTTCRAWRITLAPILMSLVCILPRDQWRMLAGRANRSRRHQCRAQRMLDAATDDMGNASNGFCGRFLPNPAIRGDLKLCLEQRVCWLCL